MLVNYYAGMKVGTVDRTRFGYFLRPFEDDRLKVSSFGQDYISEVMVSVANEIKERDDNDPQKSFIGGELEVLHVQGPNIIELRPQHRFPNP